VSLILFMEDEDNGAPEYHLESLQKNCSQCNWRGSEVYQEGDKYDYARAAKILRQRHQQASPECKETQA
jgi:hypothetical protein